MSQFTGTTHRQRRLSLVHWTDVRSSAENLVVNPSAELATTGFANFIGGSFDVTEGGFAGAWAVRKTPTGDAHGLSVTIATEDWIPGETYTATAWVRGEPGELVYLRLTNGPGQNSTSAPVVFTGEWQRLRVTRTTDLEPAGALQVVAFGGSAAETPSPWLVDAVQVEPGDRATAYLDGSLGEGYAWTGAAHASTSTRAASDVSAPGHLLHPARAGLATWVTPDWAAGDGLEHVVLHRRASADEGILLAYTSTEGVGAWRLEHTAGGEVDAVEMPASHAAGERVFLAAGWTERRLELRVGQVAAVTPRSGRWPDVPAWTRVQLGRRAEAEAGYLQGGLGPMAWYEGPLPASEAEGLRRAGRLPAAFRTGERLL